MTRSGASDGGRSPDGTGGDVFLGPNALIIGDDATQINNYYVSPQPPEGFVQIGVIPREADHFQFRTAIDDLDVALSRGDAAVLCQVVSGIGGVGKTQIAAHYARHRRDARDVDLLLWVNARSRDAIVSAYVQAGRRMACVTSNDVEEAAQEFLTCLETTDRRWLIVLDDLADPGDLRRLWPPRHPAGRVLVTTRRRDSVLTGTGRQAITVGLFSPEQATAYLAATLAAHRRDDDPEQMRGLAEDLGHLPLALAQAAAYLMDRGLDCSAYRRRLRDSRLTLREVLPEDSSLPDEQLATVAATWSLSIELADRLAPAGLARPMLELAGLLDANGIPVAVLTCPATLAYLSAQRDPAARAAADPPVRGDRDLTADDARDALRCLYRLHLVDIASGAADEIVRVHGLIQRATRDQLATDRFDRAVQAASEALLEVWPATGQFADDEAFRVNATALSANAGARLWALDAHRVLVRTGHSLGEARFLASAVAHWEQTRHASEENLGADHRETWAVRYHLALAQWTAGDHATALSSLADLLADQIRVVGTEHPRTSVTRTRLAELRGQSGDQAGAIRDFEALLADQVRTLGTDHLQTVATRRRLAIWRWTAGHRADAVRILQAVLTDQERLLGSDDRATQATRRLLTEWRVWAESPPGAAETETPPRTETKRRNRRTVRRSKARTLRLAAGGRAPTPDETRWRARELVASLKELLAEQLRALGADHPEVLATRAQLAARQWQAGDRAGALNTTEELLAEQSRVLGPEHADTLATRRRLAKRLWEGGRRADALAALKDLHALQVHMLGSDHVDPMNTHRQLIEWQWQIGNRGGAVQATETLLAKQRRLLGPDHADVMATRRRLAQWQGQLGNPERAVELLEELLAQQLRTLGSSHPRTRVTRRQLAQWRKVAGDLAGALNDTEALLAEQVRVLGPEHPDTVQTRRHADALRNDLGR
ncbi:tetratricopeptide repeat protein [Actinoallomurus sp. CA-142502]|uniref:tetratricopeptide repeat protein n=1 Tax=Actinoallomurus sp. CA-142502 TaxID=3239885 RepID=UPI003D922481